MHELSPRELALLAMFEMEAERAIYALEHGDRATAESSGRRAARLADIFLAT